MPLAETNETIHNFYLMEILISYNEERAYQLFFWRGLINWTWRPLKSSWMLPEADCLFMWARRLKLSLPLVTFTRLLYCMLQQLCKISMHLHRCQKATKYSQSKIFGAIGNCQNAKLFANYIVSNTQLSLPTYAISDTWKVILTQISSWLNEALSSHGMWIPVFCIGLYWMARIQQWQSKQRITYRTFVLDFMTAIWFWNSIY